MTYTRIKNRKFHIIYKTTCLVTDRYYIGMHSTDDLDDGYLGSGKRLSYSIRKYGRDKHHREILEHLPDRPSLAARETEIVNSLLLEDKQCMNLISGGQGGNTGFTWKDVRPELLRKARISNLLKSIENRKKNPIELKKHYEKISRTKRINGTDKSFLGKTHSPESKLKISITQKARLSDPSKNSQYGTCWVCNMHESKKIKIEHLESFIENGWKRGRNFSA